MGFLVLFYFIIISTLFSDSKIGQLKFYYFYSIKLMTFDLDVLLTFTFFLLQISIFKLALSLLFF
ncbi:expressed protein [Phakopsora pachyrhizi]|uniref:Expressed protein n=1 Tax=Phakopsora pachyrhizi TaxID=170000 RepID=A0AAV0BRK0_PHAPC|nr:expressed protein [Phakopsora pachyrhizi]